MLTADYELLRHDFPAQLNSLSNEQINQWLVRNCAFLSQGQVARLGPGGDHHELLGVAQAGGLDELLELKDPDSRRCGIRQRSGGRAATFFVDNQYTFDEAGYVQADMLDVKGIGTHASAAGHVTPALSGLLNFADALKEMCIQQLIQRLSVKEKQRWKTIQTYALIDTGLKYTGINPATGWQGERCVLTVRQQNSRAFLDYGGYNFSGILLMTGEEPPAPSVSTGCARELRKVMLKYGISSEQMPRIGFHANGQDLLSDPCASTLSVDAMGQVLEDLQGFWNIQADSALFNFMDFSDYYILPG